MLNHTGGTYSHNGMIYYPRLPISEMHLVKFPDSMEFQSWKVNFKTEVCSKTADPHLTSKKLRLPKLIDELMTSRSIMGRNGFPGCDMLDAMIASALSGLLDKHVRFRKRVSVEEQRAQKYDRFLRRERPISYMIYEYFRATGSHEAVQGLSDLFSIRLQNDDVQDFDVRWDQALFSASDMPSDVILEGLYKSKLQHSVQLQTVLALYDQETVRNDGQTSYLRLKTSGKLHIDQMMRTRNFRVRSELVERGAVTKSQKGKKACVEKVGECFLWKAHGKCSKGDSCSFSHNKSVQGDLCSGQSPAPNSKAKTVEGGEKSSNTAKGKALQTKRAKFRAVTNSVKKKIRHVNVGILLCVKTTSLRPDAYVEENVSSDMLRLRRSPAKSQRKMVRKDQLL